MMKTSQSKYVPALRFHCLTPLYDVIIGFTARESVFKQALIKQACIIHGQKVLDLATGTGTLAIWIKQQHPQTKVIGVDGDRKIITIAHRKTYKARVSVQFVQALSHCLPYPSAMYDRVFSSMFLHHLNWEDKGRTIREVYRVLKPGAELHVADWGRADNIWMRGMFLMVQILDGFNNTQDHVKGRLISLFEENGFVDVSQQKSYNTIYGTIALYRATKPDV